MKRGHTDILTDPDANTTTWTYDMLGRCVEETNALNANEFYTYDAAGNLLSKTDYEGRVTTYSYDYLGHQTEENWLDAQQNVIHTFDYTYDTMGDLLTASDSAASYSYIYNVLGQLTTITQDIAGLTPTVVFAEQYDATSDRTQLASTIGGTADFTNDYTYNGLGQMLSVAQHGATGGNAVAEKLIDITYDSAGQFNTLTRYADPALSAPSATALRTTRLTNTLVRTESSRRITRSRKSSWTTRPMISQPWIGSAVWRIRFWGSYGETPSVLDEYTYTCNRSGSVTSRANALDTALSQLYVYNNLNQLTSAVRGNDYTQTWDLDGPVLRPHLVV